MNSRGIVAIAGTLGRPAVLRFVNLSGNPKEDYLGRGIAGDLFTDVSKISGLLVASWVASPAGIAWTTF